MIEAVFLNGVDEITVYGLTQWDKGQKLKITLSSLPASFEVHFTFKRSETAYVVDVTASNGVATVDIPNAILRQPADVVAWIYLINGDAGETIKTIHLPIERRTKPADYVYEEADVANFREIVNQRIDEYIESGVIIPGATVEDVTKIREFTIDQVKFEHTGNHVQLDAFSGCPLNCVTNIEPVQSGSGDPSPDNIRPITGHTGAKLTRCGKNLLVNSDMYTPEMPLTIPAQKDDHAYVSDMSAVLLAGETYTYSMYTDGMLGFGEFGDTVEIFLLKDKTYDVLVESHTAVQNGDRISLTFSPDESGTYYLRLDVNGAGKTHKFWHLMIEKSAGATDYTPSCCQTFSASFGQTVYGGMLDWNTGELTVEWESYTFTGNEDIGAANIAESNAVQQVNITGLPTNMSTDDAICSEYAYNPAVTGGYSVGFRIYEPGFVVFGMPMEILRTYGADKGDEGSLAAAVSAYLAARHAAGKPVQIAYSLAEPYVIQLTPTQILALKGENNLWCDAGETTVNGRKDILWLTDYLLKRVHELEATVAALATAAGTESM